MTALITPMKGGGVMTKKKHPHKRSLSAEQRKALRKSGNAWWIKAVARKVEGGSDG